MSHQTDVDEATTAYNTDGKRDNSLLDFSRIQSFIFKPQHGLLLEEGENEDQGNYNHTENIHARSRRRKCCFMNCPEMCTEEESLLQSTNEHIVGHT